MNNLVPKKLIDKNGHLTTRYVKTEELSTPKRPLTQSPRPSVSPDFAASALLNSLNASRDEYVAPYEPYESEFFTPEDIESFGVKDDEYVSVIHSNKFLKAVAFDPNGHARLVAKGYVYSDDDVEWEDVKPFSSESNDIKRMALMNNKEECGYIATGTGFTKEEFSSAGPVGYVTQKGEANELFRANGSKASWVAKQTRQHIKDAIKAGLLPDDLEYKVTGSGGRVQITAKGDFHEEISERVDFDSNRQGIKEELESLAEQYNWRMSDNIGEVNNSSFYVVVYTEPSQ